MTALRDMVEQNLPRLQALTEAQASRNPAAEVWSAMQVLEHLIDSGVNNHVRFVQARAKDGLSLPGYDQNAWVAAGGYEQRPWSGVLALWAAYQMQLAQVIETLPPASLTHTLSIGGERATLDFPTTGYVLHQLHHLARVWERAEG